MHPSEISRKLKGKNEAEINSNGIRYRIIRKSPSKKTSILESNREEIYAMWDSNEYLMSTIAKKFGCSKHQIRYCLKLREKRGQNMENFDISEIYGVTHVDKTCAQAVFNDVKNKNFNGAYIGFSILDEYVFCIRDCGKTVKCVLFSILLDDSATDVVIMTDDSDAVYTSKNSNTLSVYGYLKLIELICASSGDFSITVDDSKKCSCEIEKFGTAPSSPTATEDDHIMNTLQARWV